MKYKTIFSSQIFASAISEDQEKQISESVASKMSKVKELTPWLDGKMHADLFGTAFEIALVNQFNENGDGIDSKGALRLRESFRLKQMNLEHDRSKIVGSVLEAHMCERAFGKTLWTDDVKDSDDVFSIVLSGVIYKLADKSFTKLLSSIIENGENSTIYASWEIGFDEYYIAVGNSRLLKDCEIVTDAKKIEEYSKYLKTNKGSGKLSDGRYVHRYIVGDMIALGGGFTTDPAANVDPIFAYDPIKLLGPEVATRGSSEEKNEKVGKKSSIFATLDVSKDVNDKIDLQKQGKQTMDEKLVKQLIEEAFASKQKESERQEAIANVSEKLVEAIKESNKTFVAEKEAIAKEKEAAEAALKEQSAKVEELSASVKSVEDQLSKANVELEALKTEKQKMEVQAKFDSRIDQVKEIYELDDKLSQIVAKRVSSAGSDEEFTALLEEFSVTLASFDKKAIASKAEEAETSTASKIDPITEGGKEDVTPSNTSTASAQEPSFEEKFAKAFNKESVQIK